ncbi:MAG TPA: hypothetical protein VNW52_01100, partial [Burkholderiaceae bacterium]|nr:hypothetical protein [Burkholderiaceae bacterium]
MEVVDQVDQNNGGQGFEHTLKPASPMTMRTRTAILLVGFSFSISADAVGLGALRLQSALGQPLQAQVALISPNDGDLEKNCYKAKVLTLDGTFLGNGIIDLKTDGPAPVILISTTQAINEPALDLHVEYTCAAKTRRDYQVLLDYLSVTSPVVETQRAGTALAVAEKHAPESATGASQLTDAHAPIKKSRHHRVSTEIKSATEYAEAPIVNTSEAKAKHHKKAAAKAFRNVLRLADDDNADSSLNDTAGVRLALSRNLSGSNAVVDTDVPPGVQTVNQVPALPVPTSTANAVETASATVGASTGATVANAQVADTVLQDLQAKIRVLEAETNELKKQNAQHVQDLKIAQTEKESGNALLYLYFLLFSSFVAIAWLVWRTRQIQLDMKHSSWHEIVPEQESEDDELSTDEENDIFLEQEEYLSKAKNVKPLKSVPRPSSVASAEADALASSTLQTKPAVTPTNESSESDYK